VPRYRECRRVLLPRPCGAFPYGLDGIAAESRARRAALWGNVVILLGETDTDHARAAAAMRRLAFGCRPSRCQGLALKRAHGGGCGVIAGRGAHIPLDAS
jgi:hypothetical protein